MEIEATAVEAPNPQIGLRLKQLREARGLTQEKLGALADVTGGYISQIERGEKVNPGIKTLEKLAKALGVSIHDLLNGEAA